MTLADLETLIEYHEHQAARSRRATCVFGESDRGHRERVDEALRHEEWARHLRDLQAAFRAVLALAQS